MNTPPTSDAIALDDDRIATLAWKFFRSKDAEFLTYEKSPPMFPQATYNVPTVELRKFAQALIAEDRRAREISAQPGEGYDRELIASMLDSCVRLGSGYRDESMIRQAQLLRAAENRESRAQTVRTSPPRVADALDGERLDWVIEHRSHYRVQGSDKNGWYVLDCSNGLQFITDKHPTPRQAIDAARAEAGVKS